MAKPKTGPCWKCEKPTRSHRDVLAVYTPLGATWIYLFTCHSCYDKLEEGEVTEYKIKLRDEIKAKAVVALQNQKVEAVRDQQDVEGEHPLPNALGGK